MKFSIIDIENWERKTHFDYYRNTVKCAYSLTAFLNITKFKKMLEVKGIKFFPAFVYCVSKLIKQTKEFRMGLNEDEKPGYYDCMHPNYTIFHKDDNTFSDLWTEYDDEFNVFYHNMLSDISIYKNVKGIKVKDGQPKNFYCISCVPWLSFTGYSTSTPAGTPNLFPIITYGKYQKKDGKLMMPFSVNISHAAADGYHTSKFINDLQIMLDKIILG
ncbi:chloramphenicol O-acetyltransferase type A [Clostridium algifaecis]|uniref:Chloramphenicol O-acetyltransferase type A n=1 Tax=Clostridium algifaecis TaxID=1472040 RepID=A0ABS4KPK8_9CLOT|nr:chloramphenicol acetyltransferase [Clostridium algifaecis]MBP2031972.1 chloramphenicol O-acetyltransferase type A [Clostridium algifaecis]